MDLFWVKKMGMLGKLIVGLLMLAIAGGLGFLGTSLLTTVYNQWKEGKFLQSEEFKTLIPNFEIKIFPFTETLQQPNGTRRFIKTKYSYPLKEYIFSIANTNQASATPRDTRIKFFFSNTIKEIKSYPSVHGSGNVDISMLRIFREKSPGDYETIEQSPLDTIITEEFDFSIQKFKKGESFYNTNIAEFHCERWPMESSFNARIIVDMTEDIKIVVGPEKIGSYLGAFWYEIKGKSYKGKIEGKIKTNDDEIDLAITQERENAIHLINENISAISQYVKDKYKAQGRGAVFIKLTDFNNYLRNNFQFPYLQIEEVTKFFKKDKAIRDKAFQFVQNYDVNSEFIMLIIDRKNERWLYAQKLR